MSHPFEMWSERIASAESDDARRALLAEAARWRAQHLHDVAAMRRATFAVSRLHALLGDRDRAVAEARQLLSLCQTAPAASNDEIGAARGWLQSLGEKAPRVQVAPPPRPARRERPERSERPDRGERPERPRSQPPERTEEVAPPLAEARRLAARGEWSEAEQRLDGAKGAGAAVLRAYVRLSAALASADPIAAAEGVREELRRAAGLPNERAAGPVGGDPLSELLGVAVPQKRAPRIRLVEEFAEAHPERIDALASATLRHHLGEIGPGVPAPWLVGVVGKALARGDAPETSAALAELRAAGAVAAVAYDEWPFERLVRLLARLETAGWKAGAMRRGVLAGGEPDDRKLWTLRVDREDGERMVAVAPHAGQAYPDGKAEELAARLQGLCPRTLLVATGSGNAGLRAAAAAAGLVVREHDADDDALVALVAGLAPVAAAPPEVAPAPTTDRLADLLRAEPLDEAAVADAVRGFRRPDRALRTVQRLDLPDDRVAAVLRAVDAAVEPGRPIPEGTTLAIRAAAAGGAASRALLEGARYGGPGADAVVTLAGALQRAGWDVHRVLRGPTRRECTVQPALDTLAPEMTGLWRLLVRRDDPEGTRKGEVWFLAGLPPEGRAGVPLLLVEDWQRAVVVPVEPELLAWYGTLAGAPAPIGWTGSEAEAVVQAVSSFAAGLGPADPTVEEAAPGP